MYEINLDFDPTTVGFDPREITNNGDGTYTVMRRFVHAYHRHWVGDSTYDIEAYCSCLTDDITIFCYEVLEFSGKMSYGVKYYLNDEPERAYERRSLSGSITNYFFPAGMFNRVYGTNIEDKKEETRAGICVTTLNGHPNNINPQYLFKNHKIVFGRSAPSSPQEDPFLPEAFKKMLGGNG